MCGRQDSASGRAPVMTAVVNGAHPPSTLAPVLGQSPLVPMQIYCHSSAVLLQRGAAFMEREHKHQPAMIDEQRPAAVAMSPYTASHRWEGHISMVTNEITRPNLEGKTPAHIKLRMFS